MNIKSLAGLLIVATTLAGCAAGGASKSSAPSTAAPASASGGTLETRVEQRWALLIEKKAQQAWEYLTPGYRDTHPQDTYSSAMNNRPVTWKAARYASQECESAENCTVMVEVDYVAPISAGQTRPSEHPGKQKLREKWLKVDGNWYHLPKDGL